MPSNAAFIVSDSRVVYQEGTRSRSVIIGNTGDNASVIQAWIDSGSEGSQNSVAPFMISPPVIRLNRGERRALSIFYNGNPLPKDRESLFWLNLLELQPTPSNDEQENRLKVAVNLQLKLFYRPSSLTHEQDAILDKVSFQLLREGGSTFIAVENRSPFVVSFSRWDFLLEDGSERTLSNIDMTILPFSGRRYLLSDRKIPMVTWVRTQVIDDRGGTVLRRFNVK